MPIVEYGPPVALAEAQRIIDAAEAEAEANQWAMVIAVVDSTGHLVALHRMDHAQYGSIAVAQAKARTAVDFKRPTRAIEDAIAEGGRGLRMLGLDEVCPLDGGVPLIRDDRIVGAIGVSGAQPAQDGQVAMAGARAISG